jgi:hypothetical protein
VMVLIVFGYALGCVSELFVPLGSARLWGLWGKPSVFGGLFRVLNRHWLLCRDPLG